MFISVMSTNSVQFAYRGVYDYIVYEYIVYEYIVYECIVQYSLI